MLIFFLVSEDSFNGPFKYNSGYNLKKSQLIQSLGHSFEDYIFNKNLKQKEFL